MVNFYDTDGVKGCRPPMSRDGLWTFGPICAIPRSIRRRRRHALPCAYARRVADEVELTIVTMVFDAAPAGLDRLLGVLSKYVVLSRQHPGCRNIDLMASVTTPNRFVIVQKWESPEAQQAHFDSTDMVEMAASCRGLLVAAPVIDLLEGISAHDLA
jgi:quinol monooxygenase YgiN